MFVSWLPLYHDMGLIGAWLGSLYVGFPLVVMSPLAFLARPQRWLQAIQRYRGTLSAAPNFAYELCLKRIDDAELAGLDLSLVAPRFQRRRGGQPRHARSASSSASPPAGCVPRRWRRCTAWPKRRSGCSSRRWVAGRASTASSASRSRASTAPCRRATTTPTRCASSPAAGRCPATRCASSTTPGSEVGERIEGRLEFRGPSATRGYFRNPEQTARLFHDGWLDTGDRAYAADGDIYVTGRVKDIVIRGGRNLYPQEIEEAVGAVDGVRKGCVAVFGSADAATGTERLVVLAEAHAARRGDAGQAARRRVARGDRAPSASRPTRSCWRRRTRC